MLRRIKKTPATPIKKMPALPALTAASVAESNANKLSSKGVLLLSPLLPPIINSKCCS